ncbi:CRISPR-associated protein Csn2-St [Eubacterium ventriosum]|uniref:Uncharacterized protein n=1 Tax=Eubacterium ventriosum ATCC 27560 TaxID=411463 RepID=A5Z392_9FIRM|nr:CRISPR-associated protein Csn2-St [Eubacterium ventriosum]EDM52558.1 hypothetical protein EUBVEN_00138 [Eubacterium ventriosum ATCC 27560]UWP35766.1 CRISPR-associated protein Csn2-St [Eubacterium ventriosum]
MRLTIKNFKKSYEVGLEKVNQWCGSNVIRKNEILKMLSKYFSKSKYVEWEEKIRCDVFCGKEKLGREYFEIYNVDSREQFISQLKIGKNTLLMKYILNKILMSFDIETDMEKINDLLMRIYENINNELFSSFENFSIDFESSNLFEIMQESVACNKNGENINYLSTYELIINYIELIEKLNEESGKQKLLIINNIDHMINQQEYRKIFEYSKTISEKSDINFLFTISLDGYCVVDKEDFESITIINDEEFIMPEYNRVADYIEKNYPIYRESDYQWVEYNLENCINKIGVSNQSVDLGINIILCILNRSLNVDNKVKYKTNNIELNFLNVQ